MDKIQKAREKLAEMALWCEDTVAFEELFFSRMEEGKEREALGYLLKVLFVLLKGEGAAFETLLAGVSPSKAEELKTWLRQTQARIGTQKE